MRSIPQIGNFVKTTPYGYEGLITDLVVMEADDQEWLDGQSLSPTPSERDGVWASILVNGGGAVDVSINRCTLISPIADFTHTGDKESISKLYQTIA